MLTVIDADFVAPSSSRPQYLYFDSGPHAAKSSQQSYSD